MPASSEARPAFRCPRARVQTHEVTLLGDGWLLAASEPDGHLGPGELDSLSWIEAQVPGTAAGAMRAAGSWRQGQERDFDAEDWWFRASFHAAQAAPGEQLVLCLDGIATVAEVYLNGKLILSGESMFEGHALLIGELLEDVNELAICCRALAPRLRQRRRPRARWRTRLVAEGNLRFFRTMLLGRAPGFAPGPAPVGPFREVRLERRRAFVVEDAALRASVQARSGRVDASVLLSAIGEAAPSGAELELSGPGGTHSVALELDAHGSSQRAHGELEIDRVELWWPHTHGEPVLYDARLRVEIEGEPVLAELGRVGFRTLSAGPSPDHDPLEDGLDLHVNGVRVFARGAVWTPTDAVGLSASRAQLRSALEQARAAGMNIVRIPGTSCYEQDDFHDLCDELGLLLWQDFMFANLDYPVGEDDFRARVESEARELLRRLRGRPSLAVLCGNSEIEQQVAMLGLDPGLGRGELFGELLPSLIGECGVDAVYLPSAPCGGELPFRPDRGVANYYGVGGYRRPIEDARRAGVRFAAECLAFSNVPNEETIEQMLPQAPANLVVHHPAWKAGVPRDAGTGWDFEDVRDHYLADLFSVDPVELRSVDHERYLQLSRLVSGEVMAEVFGEWRRADSPCGGGIVLWLRDLQLGAGWGVVDARGEPKVAYHHLRRALAPRAVWVTDEGLGGLVAHVANDGPEPLAATLRLALYRNFEQLLDQAEVTLEVEPHGLRQWNLETLLGRFVDATWAYRFGPPQQDLIVVSLEGGGAEPRELISQTVYFPAGRPTATEPCEQLGLSALALASEEAGAGAGGAAPTTGAVRVRVSSRRFAYGVRVHVPGFVALDDAFSIEPGAARIVDLIPRTGDGVFAGGALTAANMRGEAMISAPSSSPQETTHPASVEGTTR
jgi:beta-mannosidase